MSKEIAGKTIEEWKKELPMLTDVIQTKEVFWLNPGLADCDGRRISPDVDMADIDDAEARLQRFAPYLAKVFPETAPAKGIIESELKAVPAMQQALSDRSGAAIPGALYLKCDSHLPISGSVKARGGIYEVLKVAE